jgi:hypothetical protein
MADPSFARTLMDAEARVRAGQTQPGDIATLQSGLSQLDPADATYQRISETLRMAGEPESDRTNWLEQANREGTLPTPTLDWTQGIFGAPAPDAAGMPGTPGTGTVTIPEVTDWRSYETEPLGVGARVSANQARNQPDPTAPVDGGNSAGMGPAATAQNDPANPYLFTSGFRPGVGQTLMPGSAPGAGTLGMAAQDDETIRRGETNWLQELDRISVGEDSAFAGMGNAALPLFDITQSPNLSARAIAQNMGGGAMTAGLIAPQVEQAQNLINVGTLGGGRPREGLGAGTLSGTGRADLIEEFVTGGGQGTEIDPVSMYRDAFRRVQNTPEETLVAGAEEGGDLAAQIDTTNNALLAGINPQAAGRLSNQLSLAATEWVEAISRGETTVSYPEWLRQRGARRWVQ